MKRFCVLGFWFLFVIWILSFGFSSSVFAQYEKLSELYSKLTPLELNIKRWEAEFDEITKGIDPTRTLFEEEVRTFGKLRSEIIAEKTKLKEVNAKISKIRTEKSELKIDYAIKNKNLPYEEVQSKIPIITNEIAKLEAKIIRESKMGIIKANQVDTNSLRELKSQLGALQEMTTLMERSGRIIIKSSIDATNPKRFGAQPTGGNKVVSGGNLFNMAVCFVPDACGKIVKKYRSVLEDTVHQTLGFEEEKKEYQKQLDELDPNRPDFNQENKRIQSIINQLEKARQKSQTEADIAASNVDQINAVRNFLSRLNPFK